MNRFIVPLLSTLLLCNSCSTSSSSTKKLERPLLLPALDAPVLPPPKLRPRKFVTLRNKNVELWHLSLPQRPTFQLTVTCFYGPWTEEAGKEGAVYVLTHLLRSATIHKTRQQLASLIEGRHAKIEFSVEMYGTSFQVQGPREEMDSLLSLLDEILTSPRFDPSDFNSISQFALQNAILQMKNPSDLFLSVLNSRFFQNDRHQVPVSGNINSLRQLSMDDVLMEYRHLKECPKPIVVMTSSDAASTAMKSIQQQLKSFLNQGHAPIPRPTPPPRVTPLPAAHHFQTPLSESRIVLRNLIPPRSHPSYPSIALASEILAGSRSSRLHQVLTSELGLSSQIQSTVQATRNFGIFEVALEAPQEKTGDAVRRLKIEWENLLKTEVEPQELQRAKNRFIGLYLSQLEDPLGYVNRAAFNEWVGLDRNDLTDLPNRIQRVNSQDLLKAFNEHLNPKQTYLFVAGDARLEKELRLIDSHLTSSQLKDYLPEWSSNFDQK